MSKHTTARIIYRYLSGRPMSGRRRGGYLTAGTARWPGYRRQMLRLGAPALGVAGCAYPVESARTLLAVGAAAGVVGAHGRRRRRFDREYVSPTLAAIGPAVGLADGAGVDLRVDPTLGSLVARLAVPLSPAEEAVRLWYGRRIEPVLRWAPERLQRALWASQRRAAPATNRLAAFRRPRPEYSPRIELRIRSPYLTVDQRRMVSSIITSKIPVGDLVENWDQVGRGVVARWTVRRRPPAAVGYEKVLEYAPTLPEEECYLGQGPGDTPVTVSLHADSPHIALSAGSGAGKSVLAQLVAVQVLARGGNVVILDRKGSHRWAIGQPNVDYCSRPEQMHAALVGSAVMADERNALSMYEDDDWDCGPRTLVICEELNATIGQLTNFWSTVRQKGEPKKSPAIAALADLLFMGRSAKVNVLAIAQMLTARAIGGPEARENFGIRCLARYTANNWKMLVPEAAMPRASRTLGRWQIVIGGTATETQVAFLTVEEARSLACPRSPGTTQVNAASGPSASLLTLREAANVGVLPWSYEAAKKRLQRKVGQPPAPRGRQGTADLYDRSELASWASSPGSQTTQRVREGKP